MTRGKKGKRRRAYRLRLSILFTRSLRGRIDEPALQADGHMEAYQRRREGREVAGGGMTNR